LDYLLIVLSRSYGDNGDSGELSFTLRVASPAVLLADEVVSKIWTGQNAGDTVEEVAGVVVDWGVVDWPIKAGRLIADSAKRSDVIRAIAAAAGAVVQSNPDGSLTVVYETGTTAFNALFDVTPDAVYNDRLHILDYTEDQPEEVFDSIIITDEEGRETGSQASYNADFANTGQYVGVLTLYAVPWRVWGSDFELECTGDPSIVLRSPKIELVEVEEVVELQAGQGKTRFPVYSSFQYEYQHRKLGALAWEQDSQTLTAASAGYSLVVVKYLRRRYAFPVEHGLQVPELAQFLVVE
jgi:hypothetical protein